MTDFSFLIERVKNMTHEEVIATLKRAGILDEDGQLADHYCTKKQLRKKRRKKKANKKGGI